MKDIKSIQYQIVSQEDEGLRLDRWFKKHAPFFSHIQLEKAVRKGQVRIDGGRAKAGTRVFTGQKIRIPPVESGLHKVCDKKNNNKNNILDIDLASRLKDNIIYMDASILVLNKPSGLAVQGGSRVTQHIDGALAGLQFDALEKPRLVHRLDRDTSGLLVLARTMAAARVLARAFQAREACKTYWAVTVGVPEPREGCIKAALDKQQTSSGEKMMLATHKAVSSGQGKSAETAYQVLDYAGRHAALIAFYPHTGRKHQIRVHSADYLGTPIMGDGKYGGARAFFDAVPYRKLHLHAHAIDIAHPSGGRFQITCPIPDFFSQTLLFFGMTA